MTFDEAASRQHRHSTLYAVHLLGPNGERVTLGSTSQKSGRGLIILTSSTFAQKVIRQHIPNAEHVTFRKTGTALILSNGWCVQFGDTIRREAAGNETA